MHTQPLHSDSLQGPSASASLNEKSSSQGTAASSTTDLGKSSPQGSATSSTTDLGSGSDSDSVAVAKREHPWSGYLDDEMPEKVEGKYMRNLRHQILYLYRRLFGVVFIVNMAIFITVCVRKSNSQYIGGIVVSNLFCAILMRQDNVVNGFFHVFCSVPRSWPLWIRRICARVYHIGGLHSGAAVSGTIWFVLFTGVATREFVTTRKVSIATLVVTYIILVLLLSIVIFAHPTLRIKKHDTFELIHRFSGWLAAALVWVQYVLLANDYREVGQSLSHALIHGYPFWLIVVFTASIISPWVHLRKVPVRAQVLSHHAVRLHFDYTTPIAGSFVRISAEPWTEWHSFATIPVPGKTGFSVVVSKAGNWTTDKIMNPPKELYIRGVPTFGVMRIVPMFRRLIIVATGSGIGPCTPPVLEKRLPIRLLWTAPNVRETFGDEFTDMILEAAPDAVIYDTRKHGKPDMVKLTYRLVKEFNAEAVAIISNQKLTEKVVYGMMSRGIPAFGAIWDS